MGWYIELRIGQRTWSWRKQVPSELALLFLNDAETVDLPVDSTSDEGRFAGFKSTVARVLRNLDDIGITNNYLISLYAQHREWIIQLVSSYYQGRLRAANVLQNEDEPIKQRARQDRSQIITIQNRIREGYASREYASSVEILKRKKLPTWQGYLDEEASLLPSAIMEEPSTLLDEQILDASLIGVFLEYANNDLPEIAWLFETRLILDATPRNASVKLDLSEWIYEGGELKKWIPAAIDGLVSKVSAYSKTFETIVLSNVEIRRKLARRSLFDRWEFVQRSNLTSYEKGQALEDFFETVIESTSDLLLVGRNLYTDTQELDLVVKNEVQSPFWTSLGSPLLFIECKNWSSPVGTKEARIFESKLRDTGQFCKIGLFVALAGVTEPFLTHVSSLRRDSYAVAVVTKQDIVKFLESSNANVTKWLESIILRAVIGDKLGG
ncbi:MAG: hypothetical protein AB1589_08705 [Cyanobacteriota bacterium]